MPSLAIVDDDFRVLEALEALFESEGYSVFSFASAQALLQDTVLPQIDCLITDIGMPVIDGFELRRRAREERPGLPVIFITAWEDPGNGECVAEDRNRWFQKPFDPPALLDAVSRAIPKRAPSR